MWLLQAGGSHNPKDIPLFETFCNSKKKEQSYTLLNARKGAFRALTARMSYVLSLESPCVWLSPALLIEASIITAAAYK
jgi:hypothetical protein